MQRFIAYLSKLKLSFYVVWAILLVMEITKWPFDPFLGWQGGMPHFAVALISVLSYTLTRALLRRFPKDRIRAWMIILAFVFLVWLFFLSLNIHLGLLPGEWFMAARMTELRLQLTLAFYVLFATDLAILVALLNRMKPGG